jgi:hypothetical protein
MNAGINQRLHTTRENTSGEAEVSDEFQHSKARMYIVTRSALALHAGECRQEIKHHQQL